MPSNPQKLLKIGQPSPSRHWPDYVQEYGLTSADIPELIHLFSDASIRKARPSTLKFWTPVHAWRALGQLQASAAVAPIISQFDQMEGDDYAIEEICTVLGMIGEPALAPAAVIFHDSRQREFARILAMDALAEIARQHPLLKAEVVTHFSRYLQNATATAPGLNSLLIMHLAGLGAHEHWPAIAPLYDNGWVDLSMIDREDAEIEFGLRDERETPRQRHEDHEPLPRPEGDDVDGLAILEYYLDKYGDDDALITAPELDGFFAALACAPDTIMPSQWLPALWGGADLMPEWETEAEIGEFHELLMSEHNLVIQDFIERCYSPLFYSFEEDAPKWIFLEEWTYGFYRAASLYGPMLPEDIAVFEHYTSGLRQFATPEAMQKVTQLDDQKIAAMQEEIEASLNALHQYFFQKRIVSAHTPLTSGPHVGRNDLCPCGSGKKFKKCCLH